LRTSIDAGAKSVRILPIPENWGEKWDAADVAQLDVIPEIVFNFAEWPKFELQQKFNTIDGKTEPVIVVNGTRLGEQAQKALSALQKNNEQSPNIFVFNGRLTRVDLYPSKTGERHLKLVEMDTRTLRFELENAAKFVTVNQQKGGAETICPPPKLVCEYILAMSHYDGFQELTRLVSAPFVAGDGRVITSPGYDDQTGIFYHQAIPLKIPNTEPTEKNLAWAKRLILDELLCDFPFASEADRANAIAYFLLPFCRELINGATPLHLISAPAQGSGKTLLGEVLSKVFNPLQSICSAPKNLDADAEWRKSITTRLVSQSSHVFFDNVTGKLEVASLAAAITTTTWSDRLLGQNKEITAPNNAAWLITGNNLSLGEDMIRRTVEVRLDSQCENPFERDNFKHSNLRRWVDEQRGNLIAAAIILIRNWINLGKPTPQNLPAIGSFEQWRDVLGGILETANLAGFLQNRQDTTNRVNPEQLLWQSFFGAWYNKHGELPMKPKELYSLAKDCELFDELIFSKTEKGEITALGRRLKQQKDRIFSGFKLSHVKHGKNNQYQLLPVKVGSSGSSQSQNQELPHKQHIGYNNKNVVVGSSGSFLNSEPTCKNSSVASVPFFEDAYKDKKTTTTTTTTKKVGNTEGFTRGSSQKRGGSLGSSMPNQAAVSGGHDNLTPPDWFNELHSQSTQTYNVINKPNCCDKSKHSDCDNDDDDVWADDWAYRDTQSTNQPQVIHTQTNSGKHGKNLSRGEIEDLICKIPAEQRVDIRTEFENRQRQSNDKAIEWLLDAVENS